MTRIKVSGKGQFANKPLLIGIITGAIVLVLVILVLLRTSGPFAGQAFRPGAPTIVDTESAKSVYFQYAEGFAAPNDADVDIPLYVRAELAGTELNMELIRFCLQYDYNQFTVRDLTITLPGWSRFTPMSGVAGYLSSAGDGSVCPSGYTNFIEVAVNPGQAPILLSGAQLGVLQLTVKSDAILAARTIELDTVLVTGRNVGGTTSYEDITSKISDTAFTIVPPCPDADEDTFPRRVGDGTLIPNDVNSDYRACPTYNAVTNTIQFDCDDGNDAVHPGAAEICDGLDNDCDDTNHADGVTPETIDDGLSGSTDNDNVRGICSGRQICLGTGTMINSYLVPPDNQESVRSNAALTSSTTFSNGATLIYSFDVYEPGTESICDQLDNDCDGSIDEGLTDCAIGITAVSGARGIVSSPFGNMFIDYTGFTNGAAHANPQVIDSDDNTLYSRVYSMLTLSGCGHTGERFCSRTIAGDPGWICWDGVYYIDYGETTGLYRFSPDETLQVLTASTAVTRDTIIGNLNDGTITCG